MNSETVPGEALMRMHVEALFLHDAAGRMTRVNEPSGKAAPRFFIGRTPHGNEWRLRDDVDAALARELESACAAEPTGEQFLTPPYGSTPFEAILGRFAPIERKWAGPVYWIPHDVPVSSDTVLVTDANANVLRPHLEPWLSDVALGLPLVALVVDGHAVSICGSVRTTAVADEAGVDTPLEFRGRGYAGQVVAAWARIVREAGRVALYSTSWENTASQAVARKLGLVRFGTDLHFT